MADEDQTLETEQGAQRAAPERGPLVEVTFQKNSAHKQKYLESEPKALGITQIGLSIFQMSWVLTFNVFSLTFIISSSLVIIAGALAIAAQNLYLPTLRACLGLQIVACIASIFNLVFVMFHVIHDGTIHACWVHSYYGNSSDHDPYNYCRQIELVSSHFFAEGVLVQAALFAISVTLAVYCCKVVNCCSPEPKMPVITIQAQPAQL